MTPTPPDKDELQREVFRILDVFFTIGTERRISELEDELVEFIKQHGLEQRLNELKWAKTASVWLQSIICGLGAHPFRLLPLWRGIARINP